MRLAILILALCLPAAATAQAAQWQLVQLDDGSYLQEGGLVTVWPMSAGLYAKDRCVGEEYGTHRCVSPEARPFKQLVTVEYAALPLERVHMGGIDYRTDDAGDVRPVERPKDKPKKPKDTPVGLIATGAAATLAALGGGAAVLRGRGKA